MPPSTSVVGSYASLLSFAALVANATASSVMICARQHPREMESATWQRGAHTLMLSFTASSETVAPPRNTAACLSVSSRARGRTKPPSHTCTGGPCCAHCSICVTHACVWRTQVATGGGARALSTPERGTQSSGVLPRRSASSSSLSLGRRWNPF